jgi:adenosylhomocysteine nucleosidase
VRIGIVAALPGELKPLVKGWERRGGVHCGRFGDVELVAASAGTGSAAAGRACDLVYAEGELDALVSIGWAGALSAEFAPPHAYPVAEVVDGQTGQCHQTAISTGHRLLTTDRVVQRDERHDLCVRHQASLVDMEAATVARAAAARGTEFLCFKAVSDGVNDQLPDFNRFLDHRGRIRAAAFLAHMLSNPQYWGALVRLSRNSKAAAANLARLVTRSLSGSA